MTRPGDRRDDVPDRITSAERLRALSHPIRVQVLWTLHMNGPQRTSDLARTVEQPANKVSYHLSAMQKAGYIEHADAPVDSSDGRETWWRVSSPAGVEVDDASPEFDHIAPEIARVSDEYVAQLRTRAREISRRYPGEWPRFASAMNVPLSRAEADELHERIDALCTEIYERRASRIGQGDRWDAEYFLDLDFFPFRVADEPGRERSEGEQP